ncbi:MAG: hypothetical protein ACRD0U_04305 [Acidimicrobiales bacterium]
MAGRPPLTARPYRFGGWTKQAPPDRAVVRRLYVDEARTERDIAGLLGVSRHRVAEALAAAGVERRTPARPCPVSTERLRVLHLDEGMTTAELAVEFGVAVNTVSRWLAEAGLAAPDPGIDYDRLRRLYVEDRLTTREVAEALGVSRHRVMRALAWAGIPCRSRHDRRPRDARAAVTAERLHELYVDGNRTVAETARILAVSDEYVRRRLRECGIAKRPGTFAPKIRTDPNRLRQTAIRLYGEDEFTMADVADELGVSVSTVRCMLHEAGGAIRPGGLPAATAGLRERHLLADLYADPAVRRTLRRHRVMAPDPARWDKPGPLHSFAPLPLSEALVHDLYLEVGLATYHISLLCGVGVTYVRARLREYGIATRPSGRPCPWLVRTYLEPR